MSLEYVVELHFIFSSEPKAVMLLTPDIMLHQREVHLEQSREARPPSRSCQHFPGYNVQKNVTRPNLPCNNNGISNGRSKVDSRQRKGDKSNEISDRSVDGPDRSWYRLGQGLSRTRPFKSPAQFHGSRIMGERKPSTRRNLFRPPTLGSLEEQHLLLHDRIVLEHAERPVQARSDHCAIVARHGHGDQADGDGA